MHFIKKHLEEFGIRYTVFGVAVFIILLIFAIRAEKASADVYIGLGKAVINSHMTAGEIGYRFENQWDVQAAIIGEGNTQRGEQDQVYVASISRLIVPGWTPLGCPFYMRLGIAHVHDSPLVGETNYRLGLGCDFGVFEAEYMHYSSAGIFDPNTGIDIGVMLRVKF